MPNYEKMSVKELEEKYLVLRAKKNEIKVEMAAINKAHIKKVDKVKALKKFDDMSDAEKDAITAKVIGDAGGIPSEEKVGEPGAI